MAIDTVTRNVSVVAASPGFGWGFAIDRNSDLFVQPWGTTDIWRLDPLGSWSIFATLPASAYALAIDGAGNLFAASADANGGFVIGKYDANGNASAFATSRYPWGPIGLACDPAGNLYAAFENYDYPNYPPAIAYILKYDPQGNATTFATGLYIPASLACDDGGNLYVVDHNGWCESGTVLKYDQNGNQTIYGSVGNEGAVVAGSDGNAFVISKGLCYAPGEFDQFDASGNKTVIATGLSGGPGTTVGGVIARRPSLLGFTGFLAPLGGADTTGGSFTSSFAHLQMGSTIPVKFTASYNGAPVLSGIHTLQVIKYLNATTAETPIDATASDAATRGDQFLRRDGQWQFNLDTTGTGMSVGTWQFIARLSDGSQHTAWIHLK